MTKCARYRIGVLLVLGVVFAVPVRAMEKNPLQGKGGLSPQGGIKGDKQKKQVDINKEGEIKGLYRDNLEYEAVIGDISPYVVEVMKWMDSCIELQLLTSASSSSGGGDPTKNVISVVDKASVSRYPGIENARNLFRVPRVFKTATAQHKERERVNWTFLEGPTVDLLMVTEQEVKGQSYAYVVENVDADEYRKDKCLFLKKALCGSVGSAATAAAIAIVPWVLNDRFPTFYQDWRTQCRAAQVVTVGVGCLYAIKQLHTATNFVAVDLSAYVSTEVDPQGRTHRKMTSAEFQDKFTFAARVRDIMGVLKVESEATRQNRFVNYVINDRRKCKEGPIIQVSDIKGFNRNNGLPLVAPNKECYVFWRRPINRVT